VNRGEPRRIDQAYDRQRQVEGQNLWVSALRQSVRCPGRQLSVGCRPTRTATVRLHDSWIWAARMRAPATGSFRCTLAV